MPERILFADIGSIFTNVSLLEVERESIRVLESSAHPTTLDEPNRDVMVGLQNAIEKLQRWTGLNLISPDGLILPSNGNSGVDYFAATSSAGGGLKVLAAGLSEQITAESAQRAALGAGAIVTGVVSFNEANLAFDNIERIKNTPYDMIFVTGGTDGGNVQDVLYLVEFLCLAAQEFAPTNSHKIPLVYAGNKEARPYLREIIGDSMELVCIDNIRPTVEKESLEHAREIIQDLFLRHTMSSVPGFAALDSWVGGRIRPTPVSIGDTLVHLAHMYQHDILAVDLGGATTDIFSIINGQFFRSVSANLGMSYSVGTTLKKIDPDLVERWVPMPKAKVDTLVRNWILNKTLRPSTLPQTVEELMIEHAFAKETIRLAYKDHQEVATGLKGVKIQRDIGDIFTQYGTGGTLVDMMKIGAVIAFGGSFTKSPRSTQALSMIIDGLELQGITNVYVDTGELLPYAGLVSTGIIDPNSFAHSPPLHLLATCISPVGPKLKAGSTIAKVVIDGKEHNIIAGQIGVVPIPANSNVVIEVAPRRDFDVGAGKGNTTHITLPRSEIGLVLDGRGRPITLPKKDEERIVTLKAWYEAIGAYPQKSLVDASQTC